MNALIFRHKYLIGSLLLDAVLSCMFRTERDQNPRIEWKKKGIDVSFVYFDGHFKGEKAAWCCLSPPVPNRAFVLISLYQLEEVSPQMIA